MFLTFMCTLLLYEARKRGASYYLLQVVRSHVQPRIHGVRNIVCSVVTRLGRISAVCSSLILIVQGHCCCHRYIARKEILQSLGALDLTIWSCECRMFSNLRACPAAIFVFEAWVMRGVSAIAMFIIHAWSLQFWQMQNRSNYRTWSFSILARSWSTTDTFIYQDLSSCSVVTAPQT